MFDEFINQIQSNLIELSPNCQIPDQAFLYFPKCKKDFLLLIIY